MDNEVVLFEEELMTNIVKYSEEGKRLEVQVAIELLSKIRMRNLIQNSSDLVVMLKAHLAYLESQENILLEFDMDTLWSIVKEEESIVDRYLQIVENLLKARYGITP